MHSAAKKSCYDKGSPAVSVKFSTVRDPRYCQSFLWQPRASQGRQPEKLLAACCSGRNFAYGDIRGNEDVRARFENAVAARCTQNLFFLVSRTKFHQGAPRDVLVPSLGCHCTFYALADSQTRANSVARSPTNPVESSIMDESKRSVIHGRAA